MCGIVGAVSTRNIVPILVQGLQRLEYRGYDSCGVAVYADGLKRARSVSRVAELMEQVAAEHIAGGTGIAHTRWATHGAPAVHNAHPHFSHGPGEAAAGAAARARAWAWAEMRMRLVPPGRALRRPALVRIPGPAGDPFGVGLLHQLGHARDAARSLQPGGIDGHAAGVIAAVLQALQALHQDGDDVAGGNRADDAAHGKPFVQAMQRL